MKNLTSFMNIESTLGLVTTLVAFNSKRNLNKLKIEDGIK